MEAYKVVASVGSASPELRSFNAPNHPYSVTYKVGEWVEPTLNDSCLFVFNNMDNLKAYLSGLILNPGEAHIYRCDTDGLDYAMRFAARTWAYQEFWRDPYSVQLTARLYDVPIGTMWTRRVKLLERIH